MLWPLLATERVGLLAVSDNSFKRRPEMSRNRQAFTTRRRCPSCPRTSALFCLFGCDQWLVEDHRHTRAPQDRTLEPPRPIPILGATYSFEAWEKYMSAAVS